MNNLLNNTLVCQSFNTHSEPDPESYLEIAASYAITENALSVLSDLKTHRSHIFHGGFSETLGIARRGTRTVIQSIWENEIFDRIIPCDVEQKQVDELHFFDFVRRNGRSDNYYMSSVITMRTARGEETKTLHRIFYFHEGNAVRYALCLYTPVTTEQPAMIMDSLTGKAVLLNKVDAKQILSNREKEILRMIDAGMSSKEIAAMLNISIYTVSRHRQNILEKLHAKNSSHACTRAKNLKLI